MRIAPSILLLLLFLGISTIGYSQQPVIVGLHKIVTQDTLLQINGNDTIYLNGTGPAYTDRPRNFFITTMNAITGEILEQHPLDSASGTQNGFSSYDQNLGIYYARVLAYPPSSLVPPFGPPNFFFNTIDPGMGAQSYVPFVGVENLRDLEYDALKQKFYCYQIVSGNFFLGEFDPVNMTFQALLNVPFRPITELSTYDSNHGKMISVGTDSTRNQFLYTVDIDSMAFSAVPLPTLGKTAEPGGMWDIQYDINLDRLFGVISARNQTPPYLVEINQQTGNLDTIATLPEQNAYISMAGYDFATSSYVINLRPSGTPPVHRLYTVNVVTGAVVGDTITNQRIWQWEVDNSEFVQAKYGNVTSSPDAVDELPDQLVAYPVPVEDVLHLSWEGTGQAAYNLIDLQGRILRSGKMKRGEAEVDLATLPASVYMIRLVTDKGTQYRKVYKQ